jgi:hypothetical protein
VSTKRLMGAAMSAALAAGCYGNYIVRPGMLMPETAQVKPEDRVATWNRSITVLLDDGYVPQVVNEAAGFVSGKRRDDLVEDNLAGSTAIVTITPEGLVRVEVSGAGIYSSQEQLVGDVRAEQTRLINRLMGRSQPDGGTSQQ